MSAQGTNGVFTVMQDVVSSAGGLVSGGSSMSAQTSLGLPASGTASNGIFTLVGGMGGATGAPPQQPFSATTTIMGTVDDPSASVTVNGAPAVMSGLTFRADNVRLTAGPNTVTAIARDGLGNQSSKSLTLYLDLPQAQKESRFNIVVSGTINEPSATVAVNGVSASIVSDQFTASVPLVSGYNTITAVAKDAAGNQATISRGVFVPAPTTHPAMPTVGTMGNAPPTVSTQSSVTLGGTKTPGTAIWINGQQIVASDNATTWSTTLTLTEGDNEFTFVARDAAGASSASVSLNIIVDNLPPVVTFTPPTKTNLNPTLLTGSVDDSQTTVTINGIVATRTKRAFEVPVSLVLGPNVLHLVAISPNGYQTLKDYVVVLGTIPSIQALQPADGAKIYMNAPTALQVTAQDQEGDPIQYQFLIDNTPLGDWGSSTSTTWTPGTSQAGLHKVTVSVRDAYGGANSKDAEAYVVRSPVNHP